MKTLIGILRQALPNIAFLSLERISMVTLILIVVPEIQTRQ
jgi:hypothetical protein